MTDDEYITNQLLQLCPVTTDKAAYFGLKLHSSFGETHWLNISKEQLHKIEGILCEGAENAN